MKRSKTATQAIRMIRVLQKKFADLPKFCREAHEITLNDEECRQRLYESIWKDGVRTIEGVLERCELASSILYRRGLNAETRVAALWFTLFHGDACHIESAVELCADKLKDTDSEYRVADLPKLLGFEKAKPLVVLWQQYTALCTAVAARVGTLLDYQRSIRFWLLYVATVRRDEIAGIVRDLRNAEKPDRDLVFRLVSGGRPEDGSVSMESVRNDFDLFVRGQLREEQDDTIVRRLIEHGTKTRVNFYLLKTGFTVYNSWRKDDQKVVVLEGTKVHLLGFWFRKGAAPNAVWRLSDGSLMYTPIGSSVHGMIDGLPKDGISTKVAARYKWDPPADENKK